MKRAALYVRVSTQEQKKHGLSVDSQIIALKEYCEANDYIVAGIYNDAGISARKKYTKRPALLSLINDCENNKIDIILFTKLDRWFRSVGDYYEVQKHLDACKVPWRTIWEDYETETSSGIFKVNIMLSVAQSEADRTSERIKSTFDYKRSKGDYIGTAPMGYKRENNRLVKDPEKAWMIEMLFETYMQTHSSTKARQKINSTGAFISKSSVERILSTPTYAGNANGSECEGYLTPEQFEEIQRIKQSNYRVPRVSCNSMFNSIMYCGICNKRMRTINCNQKGVFYPSYYCQSYAKNPPHTNGINISQNKVEKYLLEELDSLIDEHEAKVIIQNIEVEMDETSQKKKALENKLERIGIRFEEGDITLQEYKEKRKTISAEIASLSSPTKLRKIEIPDNWKEIYNALDYELKKEFWFSIIDKIYYFRNPDKTYYYQVIFKN